MDCTLELWLCHPDGAMADAFRDRFKNLPAVRIFQGPFEDLPPHDCFVTAGNAFGIMTAGIDAAVARFFGPTLMPRVQAHIRECYLGEQPVGTAFILATNHPRVPFLAHAPTMRVPGGIDGTDKIYCAMWAALLAIHAHNTGGLPHIGTVALPALGTGFGQVPFTEAARQMAAAYRHYLHPPARLDWDAVIARQKAICYDGPKQVVRSS
jgi:O-acetyl-ADP-ribose deacetylase (regulator of RNase III)